MRKQVPQDFPSNRICGIDILLVSPPDSTTKVNLRDPQQQSTQIKWGRSMSKRPGHFHRQLPRRILPILHSPFDLSGIQPMSNQPDFPSNRICSIDILPVSPPDSTTKVNLRDPQQQHSQIKWDRSMSKRPGHPHRRLPQRILHSPFGIQPLSNQPDHPSIRVLHFHIRSKRSLTSHLLPRGNTPFLHSSVNLRLPGSKFERENNDAKVFHQENGRSFWIFYVFWPPLSGSRIYYRYTRNVHLSNQSCGDA